MGRSLGKGIRELKTSLSAHDDEVEDGEFVPAPRARDHESVG